MAQRPDPVSVSSNSPDSNEALFGKVARCDRIGSHGTVSGPKATGLSPTTMFHVTKGGLRNFGISIMILGVIMNIHRQLVTCGHKSFSKMREYDPFFFLEES